MPKQPRLATILAALSLATSAAACGGDNDDAVVNDGGSKQDSGGGGKEDASTAEDASTVKDASSPMDASSGADAGADAGTDGGGKVLSSVSGGSISVLDGGTSMAKGSALLVRTVDAGSWVSLQVSGLDSGTMYPAHVHVAPCATYAGGHYMLDPDAGAGQANEVWPSLMTDGTGQARTFVSVPQVLRDDAKAIVVHEVDGGKLLCADLVAKAPYTTTGGPSKKFPAATDAGIEGITGNGTLTRSDDGKTQASIDVQGLKPDTQYMVHVHDQPCDFASGGGHYKIDYGNDAAVESNEIWLNLTATDAGAGQKSLTVTHSARAEAQAIVIHAMDGTRLVCFDLKP